ncbi:hypothetical protein DSO57_1026620 [Entomophthora muscae]|uniref:Uncharacterized protein n=1 Tax=Entomophthora muscae TaxID=34485 RepID=A0ACC2SFB5_9FUNG|nr:hypothetical protein DSO57_1026620 [Entomophthora muscae]
MARVEERRSKTREEEWASSTAAKLLEGEVELADLICFLVSSAYRRTSKSEASEAKDAGRD